MVTQTRRAESFADALSALKRRGCNLLVLHGPGETDGICSDLLGDPGEARRHLLVSTTGTVGGAGLPREPGPSTAVIDATGSDMRSAAAASSAAAPTPDRRPEVADPTDLGELARLIDREADRFERESGPLAASELRLCVNSLDPMVERSELDEVVRFLHAVTARVRAVKGMGHFHLSAEAADETVETIGPAFDITIEVRSSIDGALQQRWRLHEAAIDTGWLQMGSV